MELTPATHLAIADDLKRTAEAMRAELRELEAAESFHRKRAVTAHRNGSTTTTTPTTKTTISIPRDAFKHDAAKLALAAIGRPAKTAEIEKLLRDSGYGNDIDNFSNSLFTAMARKDEMFRKIGRGTWALTEWPQNGEEGEEEEAQ